MSDSENEDVPAETAASSNLGGGTDQAGDVPAEVSGSGRRVRNYFDVEHDSIVQLNRSKIARLNAETLDETFHHENSVQSNTNKAARLNADILAEDTHRENMVRAAVMRQQQQPFQVDQLNRLERMVRSLGEAVQSLGEAINSNIQNFKGEVRNALHESRVDNTRARNLTLRLAGLDVEPVPFLVGDRPSDLREIRKDSDVAALGTEEANAYCVGYRLSTEGLLAAKKLRIKNFVNLWNVRAGPYEAEGV